MNREFLFSLGIILLTSTILFLYFRNRFKIVEHKVNTIFQLVQSHAQPPSCVMRQPPPMPPRMDKSMEPVPPNLIEVSDDEYSDSDESDGQSDSSSVSEKNILFGNEIKQISVTLGGNIDVPKEINLAEKVDNDLDDVGSLDDDNVEEPNNVQDTPNDDPVDYSKLTVPNLKKIAAEKGFTNYRKLRKQGLVELLSN